MMSNAVLDNLANEISAAEKQARTNYWDIRCRLVAGETIPGDVILQTLLLAGRTKEHKSIRTRNLHRFVPSLLRQRSSASIWTMLREAGLNPAIARPSRDFCRRQ
jgi:hypothetical protein